MHISFYHHHSFRNRNNHALRLRLFRDGLIIGVWAGLVISLFRFLLQFGEEQRTVLYDNLRQIFVAPAPVLLQKLLLWLIALLLIGAILHKLIRLEPLAGGSGIPQVKGALLNLIEMNWLRILWVKIVGGVLAIGAGLSLGREGPSIQLGAMAAQGYSRIRHYTKTEERFLLTSGAAAGLAAAFNAPLAGVIFALEELHHNFSMAVLLPSMGAAFAATIISRLLFGSSSVFLFPEFHALPLSSFYLVIITAILAGLAGVIFNWGLLNIGKFYQLKYFQNLSLKLVFALGSSVLLGFTLPQVLGGGSELINYLAKTPVTLHFLLLLLVTKFIFTLLSYGIGCPGGFFLPMLVIGALTGGVCAQSFAELNLLPGNYGMNILVIAMVAFFAASVRAPITGTVLIMEMSKSYSILLNCAIGGMIGFVIAEILESQPIYEALLNRTLHEQKYTQLLQESTLEERNHTLQEQDSFYSQD